MSGTKSGGLKAAAKNKEKFGEDYYAQIGAAGGRKGTTGGFYHFKYVLGDEEHARRAGQKGGSKSKRTIQNA
jgi:hypothetical protein